MSDFEPNLDPEPLPKIPLPQGWSDLVLLALLHTITLARLAIMNARNRPDSPECDGLRLRPCAKPRTMIAGKSGRKVDVRLAFLEDRKHLPIIQILRE